MGKKFMAASGGMLFLILAIGAFIFSSMIVIAVNYLFSRAQKILMFFYILILSGFIYFWFINYWGRSEMNSASINFSSNSTVLQFLPKRDGEYDVSLTFLNNKANDIFKKCEFFWLEDSKSQAECRNGLIYKKIIVDINNKIMHGQYSYQDWNNVFNYGYNIVGNVNPSLNLAKLVLRKNELINFKVSIDASYKNILNDQPVLMVGPDEDFYYAGISSGLLLLIISIPILISIIYFSIKLKR
jgi:hypothetical protein